VRGIVTALAWALKTTAPSRRDAPSQAVFFDFAAFHEEHLLGRGFFYQLANGISII
jgi:hypothetical protein